MTIVDTTENTDTWVWYKDSDSRWFIGRIDAIFRVLLIILGIMLTTLSNLINNNSDYISLMLSIPLVVILAYYVHVVLTQDINGRVRSFWLISMYVFPFITVLLLFFKASVDEKLDNDFDFVSYANREFDIWILLIGLFLAITIANLFSLYVYQKIQITFAKFSNEPSQLITRSNYREFVENYTFSISSFITLILVVTTTLLVIFEDITDPSSAFVGFLVLIFMFLFIATLVVLLIILTSLFAFLERSLKHLINRK